MLAGLIARIRPDPLRSQVEAAIRRGTGLSREEWQLDASPLSDAHIAGVTEEMLAWLRERISTSRRPYGIDQMALAVACAIPGSTPLASASFGVFRPVEFYAEDGVAEHVRHFLRSVHLDDLNRRQAPVRFAVALFAWGDVARETVFADER